MFFAGVLGNTSGRVLQVDLVVSRLRRLRKLVLCLVVVHVLMGCHVGTIATQRAGWLRRHGGVVHDSVLHNRLIISSEPLLVCLGMRFRFFVLDSVAMTAYAWSDGSVYVSRGLVEALDNNQLAAVVAHEVGHLLDDDRLPGAQWSFEGHAQHLDAEVRADFIGCRLLQDTGINPKALIRTLKVVHQRDGLTAKNRQAIGRRIDLLRSTFE